MKEEDIEQMLEQQARRNRHLRDHASLMLERNNADFQQWCAHQRRHAMASRMAIALLLVTTVATATLSLMASPQYYHIAGDGNREAVLVTVGNILHKA